MGPELQVRLKDEPGKPVLMWSVPNPDRYPSWISAATLSPGGEQLTIVKDKWLRVRDGGITECPPSALADAIAHDIIQQALPSDQL